ncbi:hypothetical protein B0T14DRAFT_493274 [Immersiella caudata]|uniref:Uncharacterized protein n=1 Tax=Immersiella caudata TaxID=314043 RepID=A0AA39X4D3_9PEZI|nr:hypothetical protein B0T14DRAFT_493274 [Immersiella caudata]
MAHLQLTEERLKGLQRALAASPSAVSSTSSITSRQNETPDSTEEAKQSALHVLSKLRRLSKDIDNKASLREFFNAICCLRDIRKADSHSAEFWNAKRAEFEKVYDHVTDLREKKCRIYLTWRAIERLGDEGRKTLREEDELVISHGVVNHRDGSTDLKYWESKLQALRSQYTLLKRRSTLRFPSLITPENAKRWISDLQAALKRDRGEDSWALKYSYDPDPNEVDQARQLGQSYTVIKNKERRQHPPPPDVGLEQAMQMVFDVMFALALDPEGCRILEEDELRIIGWNTLNRIDGRQHDTAYWIEKLRYFEDRYNEITLWNSELEALKTKVQNALGRLRELGDIGLLAATSSDHYLDEQYNLRYRGDDHYDSRYQGRERPDLRDPQYWELQLRHIEQKYEHANQSLAPKDLTAEELEEVSLMKQEYGTCLEEPRLTQPEALVRAWVSQLTAENDAEWDSGCVQKNTRSKKLGLADGRNDPGDDLRKSSRVEEMGRVASQAQASPLHPVKTLARDSRATKNASQRRSLRAARSAPTTAEDLPPNRRRRPSKLHAAEKLSDKTQPQRGSRRLAGQLPEFGLLGETQSLYGTSLQLSNARKMSSPGARNGRLLKKPTAKGAEPQGVLKIGRNPRRSARIQGLNIGTPDLQLRAI